MKRPPTTRPAPRLALAIVGLAAALAAGPAEAQRGGGVPPSRTTGAEVPLPPPPPGTRLERRGATFGVAVGPWAAFETGKSNAVHADYGFPHELAGLGRLQLELRLGVTIARPTEDTPISRAILPAFGPPVYVDAGVEELRAWLVEVVPTARVRLPLANRFAVFVDGGAGIVQTREEYDRQEMFRGRVVTRRWVTGLALRVGAGLSLDVAERVRVLFEPLALSFHAGPKFSSFAPSLGVAYRP